MSISNQKYAVTRAGFLIKSLEVFEFLLTEFNFKSPIHVEAELSDKIEYVNNKGIVVQLYNAYHPVDYGFEINIINQAFPISEQMIYDKPKEQQDCNHEYLGDAAITLKHKLKSLELG